MQSSADNFVVGFEELKAVVASNLHIVTRSTASRPECLLEFACATTKFVDL